MAYLILQYAGWGRTKRKTIFEENTNPLHYDFHSFHLPHSLPLWQSFPPVFLSNRNDALSDESSWIQTNQRRRRFRLAMGQSRYICLFLWMGRRCDTETKAHAANNFTEERYNFL